MGSEHTDGVAAFDLPAGRRDDGEMIVYPDALIFKVGEYPDQGFSMTPEELRAAAEDFRGPVPTELEHFSTHGARHILHGKTGELRDVRVSEDGAELRGTVAIPRWLDAAWDAPIKKISAAWDRATKRLLRLGLVIRGAVPEAALFSAYAAFAATRLKIGDRVRVAGAPHESGQDVGTVALIEPGPAYGIRFDNPETDEDEHESESGDDTGGIHKWYVGSELVAESGDAVAMAAPIRHDEATRFMQDVHDDAVELDPAVCNPRAKAARPDRAARGSVSVSFADHPDQLIAIKRMHDLAVRHGASCPGKAATMSGMTNQDPEKGAKKMNWVDRFATFVGVDPERLAWMSQKKAKALSSVAMAEDSEFEAQDPPPMTSNNQPADPVAAFAESPVYKEMRAELDRQKAQLEEAARREVERAEEELRGRAAAFAATLVTGDPTRGIAPRITPAAREAVAAVFAQAVRDDARHQAVVTFSVGDKKVEGGRVAALEALFAALPGHTLLAQSIAPQGRLDPAKYSLFSGPTRASEDEDPETINRMRMAVGLPPVTNGAAK